MMEHFIGEFTGTLLLMILGNGVVANVVLDKTKGHQGGWIVITSGWAIAVFIGVFISIKLGGSGHLNPAVTLAAAAFDGFDQALVSTYIIAQMAGAFIGSSLVWIAYKPHFDVTEDQELKRAVFCTSPAIKSTFHNLFIEILGTFVLAFGALTMIDPGDPLGTLKILPIAFLVFGIGLSLGGPTGYAINPARDLGPRLAHFFLPIKNKGDSDWGYAWIPIVGPILGAFIASAVYHLI